MTQILKPRSQIEMIQDLRGVGFTTEQAETHVEIYSQLADEKAFQHQLMGEILNLKEEMKMLRKLCAHQNKF
jgi:hypothetical protein